MKRDHPGDALHDADRHRGGAAAGGLRSGVDGPPQAGTETSVREGNLEVAEQVASQVKLYVDNNARILRSAGEQLSATSLARWQQTRILTNHVLEFPEFREISILDASGRTIASSRLGEALVKLPCTRRPRTASSRRSVRTTMRCRPPLSLR